MQGNNYNEFQPYQQQSYRPAENGEAVVRNVMTKTYLFMFAVLIISGIAAYATAASGLFFTIFSNRYIFYGMLIGEVVLVLVADIVMSKNQAVPSAICLLAYSIVNGMTLASIFYLYSLGSIVSIFLMAAGIFGIMAAYGAITKKDLTSLGSIGMMGLLGIILIGVVNMFFLKSEGISIGIAAVGLAIFIGLTAYDAQKIKQMARSNVNTSENVLAMFGALILYLDFINIFLKLLRLFGKRD